MACFKGLIRTKWRATVENLSSNPKAAVGGRARSPTPKSHESYQAYHKTPIPFIQADHDSSLVRGPLTVRNPGPNDSPIFVRFDETRHPTPETLWEGPITPASFELPELENEEQSDDELDEHVDPRSFNERAPSRLGFYLTENETESSRSLPTITEEMQESDERGYCLMTYLPLEMRLTGAHNSLSDREERVTLGVLLARDEAKDDARDQQQRVQQPANCGTFAQRMLERVKRAAGALKDPLSPKKPTRPPKVRRVLRRSDPRIRWSFPGQRQGRTERPPSSSSPKPRILPVRISSIFKTRRSPPLPSIIITPPAPMDDVTPSVPVDDVPPLPLSDLTTTPTISANDTPFLPVPTPPIIFNPPFETDDALLLPNPVPTISVSCSDSLGENSPSSSFVDVVLSTETDVGRKYRPSTHVWRLVFERMADIQVIVKKLEVAAEELGKLGEAVEKLEKMEAAIDYKWELEGLLTRQEDKD